MEQKSHVNKSGNFNSFLGTMTPHSTLQVTGIIGNKDKIWRVTEYYGVSSTYRLLSTGLFIKKYEDIRKFLENVLGFSVGNRDVTLRILRLWASYGKVYAKVADMGQKPGSSKSTTHRTISKLKELGLLKVIPRYLIPWRRQISNLYLLNKLLLVLARYLAEHGQRFYQKWLEPYMAMPGREFWGVFAWSDDLCSLPSP